MKKTIDLNERKEKKREIGVEGGFIKLKKKTIILLLTFKNSNYYYSSSLKYTRNNFAMVALQKMKLV